MAFSVISNSQFPEIDATRWRVLAEKALQGAAFEDTLVSHTDDGIAIRPVYARAEAKPAGRRHQAMPWRMVQRIDDPDAGRANMQALEDANNGATGLALVFEGAPNAFGFGIPANREALARILADLPLDRLYLRIDSHPLSRASIDWIIEIYGARRIDPAGLTFSLGLDPAAIFAGTGRLSMSIEALQASLPQSLAHFFALGLPGVLLEADGRVYHNAGATEAQELGAMLAGAVSHLRMFEQARQPLIYAAPHIGFSLSVDQDQFVSIAKIRALRRLWSRVQEACGIEPTPATIHAETSWRMISFKDPETNILRSTVAAFSAAVGGADSISVVPHTAAHGLADGFARRIARNIQLILADESHLGFVADPMAGAGGIEALTEALCERAWSEFQAVEALGGLMPALASGRLQAQIRKSRDMRAARYAAGEIAIVGTNRYPADRERPVAVLEAPVRPMPTEGAVHCDRLDTVRIDMLDGGAA
ncbi:MAG: methylmalonyl-CoA mutase subunit beta [Rhizobiaceae bacterium]